MTAYVPADFGLAKNGPQFAWLDWRLTVHGFPPIRLLDPPKDRVQRFQLKQGWRGNGADGLVGPLTLARLTAEPIVEPPPTPHNIDLTDWKLTLPTDATGDGKADEIKQPTLSDFKFVPWFYRRIDGGIAFRANCGGATTSGSGYPRSELREMTNGGKDLARWDTDDGAIHTMTAELAFTHLPDVKPHAVAMQIHNGSDDVTVLRLEGTDLWVTKGDAKFKKIATGYVLGTRIKVKVEASVAGIRWWLDDRHVATVPGSADDCYFKAGVYTQSNVSKGDKADAYGEVVLYKLEVDHA